VPICKLKLVSDGQGVSNLKELDETREAWPCEADKQYCLPCINTRQAIFTHEDTTIVTYKGTTVVIYKGKPIVTYHYTPIFTYKGKPIFTHKDTPIYSHTRTRPTTFVAVPVVFFSNHD
jgi:hypothetical protein